MPYAEWPTPPIIHYPNKIDLEQSEQTSIA
jgi:hypothetical protein